MFVFSLNFPFSVMLTKMPVLQFALNKLKLCTGCSESWSAINYWGHPVPLQPFQSKGEKAFLTSFWQKKKATTVLSPTWEIRLKKMMKMACQIVLHSVAKKWKNKWENISKIGVFLFLTSSDLGGHRVHTFIWIFPPKIAVTL